MTKKILIIDDDTRLRILLGKFLSENNFIVELTKDTAEAKLVLSSNQFDLLIVDVMLPNQTGFEFTKEIRQHNSIPIIILTARQEQEDRITGLECGADDYLPKPFEPKELLLRINNILKRLPSDQVKKLPKIINFGDFSFDLTQLRLKKQDEFIHLTEIEAKTLKIFAENIAKPISRNQLCDLLNTSDDRNIDVNITRLRRKIENNPKKPYHLQTVRNIGYILYP
jgi:two-component system phosphate regulon response regulator OmpR